MQMRHSNFRPILLNALLMAVAFPAIFTANINLNLKQSSIFFRRKSLKFSLFTTSGINLGHIVTNSMTKEQKQLELLRVSLRKSIKCGAGMAAFCKSGPGDYAEHDKFLGVTNPSIRLLAKKYSDLSLSQVKCLLESKYNEERFLGLVIVTERYKKSANNESLRVELYQFYLANMQHINNWNLVDTSAHLIIGEHLLTRDRNQLLILAESKVMWERRIAIVSTLAFIRNDDLEWTFKISEMLQCDPHDLIHKATGWMLREAGKRDISKLLEFLDKFSYKMPRTMLRYSIEKLSAAQRKHYLSLKR